MRYFAQKENADLIYISEKKNAEFLWAIGDTVSTSLVKKLFEAGQALGERMIENYLETSDYICWWEECRRQLMNISKRIIFEKWTP